MAEPAAARMTLADQAFVNVLAALVCGQHSPIDRQAMWRDELGTILPQVNRGDAVLAPLATAAEALLALGIGPEAPTDSEPARKWWFARDDARIALHAFFQHRACATLRALELSKRSPE